MTFHGVNTHINLYSLKVLKQKDLLCIAQVMFWKSIHAKYAKAYKLFYAFAYTASFTALIFADMYLVHALLCVACSRKPG